MDNLFVDGFVPLLRVVISVPLIYFAVVAFVRASGKRTTGQMNGFDWIVTVAMGSLVASCRPSAPVPYRSSTRCSPSRCCWRCSMR